MATLYRDPQAGQKIVAELLQQEKPRPLNDNETFILSPEVGENADLLAIVKSFEDNFNDKLRKKEKEKAAAAELNRVNNGGAASEQAPVSRFFQAQQGTGTPPACPATPVFACAVSPEEGGGAAFLFAATGLLAGLAIARRRAKRG